jgi:dienelactone hydrolase
MAIHGRGMKWIGALALLLGGGVLVFHPSRPLYLTHRQTDISAPDGIVLSGTLTRSRWLRRPLPALVIVHGSGPLTRRHLTGDIRRLAQMGFAVLAYDKRGAGASGGVYAPNLAGSPDSMLRILAADAAEVLEHLRFQDGVDEHRVGFFGASQAGWIIPLAATLLDPPPRFHVILSGPAVPTGVEHFYSMMTGDGTRVPQVSDAGEIRRRLAAYSGNPGFDPLPFLADTPVPTLWLLGDRDQSVPTFASARVLDSLAQAGQRAHTVIRYPDAGHDLRDVETGKPVPLWQDIQEWMRTVAVFPVFE